LVSKSHPARNGLEIAPEESSARSPEAPGRGRLGGPCRLCGETLEHTVIDLGVSPLCETFLSRDELNAAEVFYPLHVLVCTGCFLVQLGEYTSPESIFREYAYFSSYSSSWLAHCEDYVESITRRLDLNSASLVVELGSNDGYLLQYFQRRGVPVLGIEPARNVAQVALDQGIPTVVDFFGQELAQRLVSQGYRADLVCGANVMAQVPDLNDFVAGIKTILSPDGVCTIEMPHLQRMLEGNEFDTIYHEHYSYFSALSLRCLAERHGLQLFDIEELPTHGGSLRAYFAHQGSSHRVLPAVDKLITQELDAGLTRLETYENFAENVKRTKRHLLGILSAVRSAGQTVVGYGAPGKGNTLLNYCGIGTDLLDFTVDRNPYKHGRYTPGMHIPIRPVEALAEARPDYVLILPWNLRDEISQQMRQIGSWGGKFIVPIPRAEIVDPPGV
jgi:SAM-dependent methyltransferase